MSSDDAERERDADSDEATAGAADDQADTAATERDTPTDHAAAEGAEGSEDAAESTAETDATGRSGVGVGNATDDLAPAEVGRGMFSDGKPPSTAFAHLYRGEVHRMNRWRTRLDRSTKWAVTMSAAVVTFAFSSSSNPHYIVLIGIGTLLAFLGIEAHRYRAYDVWRSRVRLIQENAIALGLDPSYSLVDENWRTELAEDYQKPEIKITFEEALAHRLRRVYLPLLLLLVATWVAHISIFGTGPLPREAAIGGIPGLGVIAMMGLLILGAVVIAFRPREWQAKTELRDRNIAAWKD